MFCPSCGRECAAHANFCSSCGASVTGAPDASKSARVVRPRYPRMIAGVCAGLALYYGWDVALTRTVAVALAILTSGLGVLVYIAAWIIIPEALYTLPQGSQQQTPV